MIKWLCFSLGIGFLNYFGEGPAKKIAFSKGCQVSKKFQKYPGWNGIVEPFLIRQFAILFGVSNAFLQGMLSDNLNVEKDKEILKQSLEQQLKDDKWESPKNKQ